MSLFQPHFIGKRKERLTELASKLLMYYNAKVCYQYEWCGFTRSQVLDLFYKTSKSTQKVQLKKIHDFDFSFGKPKINTNYFKIYLDFKVVSVDFGLPKLKSKSGIFFNFTL